MAFKWFFSTVFLTRNFKCVESALTLNSLFQREIPTAPEELLHDRAIPGAQVRVRLCPVLLPLQEDRELQADAAQAPKDRRQPPVAPRQPADRRGDCTRYTGCCHPPNGECPAGLLYFHFILRERIGNNVENS